MRRRLMLKSRAGVSPVLPAEYQQVEWIKGTSVNYNTNNIKTNLNIDSECIIEIICLLDDSSNYQRLADCGVLGYYDFRNGSLSNRTYNRSLNFSLNTIHSVKQSATEFKIDDASIAMPNLGSRSGSFMLLAQNDSDRDGKFTIYSVRITKNNMPVLVFVPCYRKSDGEIGMYDTVSQTFYTNSGTGTFAKGADVN